MHSSAMFVHYSCRTTKVMERKATERKHLMENMARKVPARKANMMMTSMDHIIRQSQTLTLLTSLIHTPTTNQNRPRTTNQSHLLNQVCKSTITFYLIANEFHNLTPKFSLILYSLIFTVYTLKKIPK